MFFFGKIIIIFSDFQNLSECVFCRKFAGKFVKVHSGCPGEHFQAAFFSFFEQKTFRLSANVSRPPEDHFEYWFERITLLFITYSHKKSSFGGQLTTGLSKMRSGCLGEFSEGKQLFWKKYMFFLIIFALRTKFFSKTWRGSFSTVVWTAFYVSRGRVWAKTNFLESVHLFVIFVTSIKKLRITGKKYQQARHNCNLGIQKNILWKKVSEKAFFIYISVTWPENFSPFRQKLFVKFVKKAFYVSWGTCWGFFPGKKR